MKRDYVSLVDCTLREGNQAPGVCFTVENSTIIARQLCDVGVDCVEVGHPYASKREFDRVAAVRKALPEMNLLAHARARPEDIDAVANAGASSVGIFVGVNEYSQKYRLNKPFDEILQLIKSNVRHAKSLGLAVRYTVEDATRTSYRDLQIAYEVALEAGADRLCDLAPEKRIPC